MRLRKHSEAGPRQGTRLWPLCLGVGPAACVAVVALVAQPTYVALLREDGWGEWATFFAFTLASVLAARGARNATGHLQVGLLGSLGVFCAFVAGEELSWGQRLFGFTPPPMFLERNYQQEANVHNLLTDILDTRWVVLAIAVLYGIVAPFIGPLLGQRFAPRLAAPWPSTALVPGFAVVAALELFYPWTLSGELAELTLGLCFVSDIALRTSGEHAKRVALRSVALALGVAGVLPLLIDTLTLGGSAQANAHAQAELKLLAADLRAPGVVQARLRDKRKVDKRLFTAVRVGYLRFGARSEFLQGRTTPAEDTAGEARRDARGYFIDPWSQPYWLRYERLGARHGRLLLYSFGANRRRDGTDRLAGDDLGVTIEVRWR